MGAAGSVRSSTIGHANPQQVWRVRAGRRGRGQYGSHQAGAPVRPGSSAMVSGCSDEALRPFDPQEEEETEVEKLGQEEEGHEERKARVASKPVMPGEAEVEAHKAAGHCPYRSWCKFCVMGHGVSAPHRLRKEESGSKVPSVSMDYMYMGNGDQGNEGAMEDEAGGGGMPILVMIDDVSDMTFASVIPRKGVTPYAVVRSCNDLAL